MNEEQTYPAGEVVAGETYPQPNGQPEGTSYMDGLREMRKRKAEEAERRLVLDIPGYSNRLAVIYHYPEDGYKRAVKAIEREIEGERLVGASDLLIVACAAIVGRNADGALVDPQTEAVLGDDELPPTPLRFNKTLAEALQIAVPEEVKGVGRHVIRQVFSPRGAVTGVYDGDLALIAQSNIVFAWLNRIEADTDEATLGE